MYKRKIKLIKDKFIIDSNDTLQRRDNCSLTITKTPYSVDKYLSKSTIKTLEQYPLTLF